MARGNFSLPVLTLSEKISFRCQHERIIFSLTKFTLDGYDGGQTKLSASQR